MSNIVTVPSHVAGDTFTAGMWSNLQGNINDGIVNQVCAARVYSTANFPTTATFAAVTFNSERYDGDNMHTSGNPTQLVCNTAGIYHIGACAEFPTDAGAGRLNLGLRVNGTILIAWAYGMANSATTSHLQVSCDYLLNATDYVEMVVASQGGLTVQASANLSPEFWMHRI